MKISSEDLMLLLGKDTADSGMQALFKQLGGISPIAYPYTEGDFYIGDEEEIGYVLMFEDEALIRNDPYADIGDGELVFVSFVVQQNKKPIASPPYGIEFGDSYEEILKKMGRKEDKTGSFLPSKLWVIELGNSVLVFSCDFKDESYSNCYKIQCDFHYGQFKWIDDSLTETAQ